MSTEQQKKIAYELSIKYMEQRNLLKEVDEHIPEIVERFSDVYEKFYTALSESKLQNLL